MSGARCELPREASQARDDLVVVAPDGIAVHPIALPGIAGLSLAEGRLPPGEYGVHAHRSLEQVTYVLTGRLIVTMSDPATGATVEIGGQPGDAIRTSPLVPLSFRNPGPGLTRVLFICAPPYPADNADTVTFEHHRPLTSGELRAALDRQRAVSARMVADFAERIAVTKAFLGQQGEE